MPLNIQNPLPTRRLEGMGQRFQNLAGPPATAFAALGDIYQGDYNNAFDINEAMANNYMTGMQQVIDNQTTASDALSRGYTQTFDRLQQAQTDTQKGYGGAFYDLQQGGNALGQGWDDLTSRVLGGIQGIGNERGRQIDDTYTRESGNLGQSLVSRGLGNSTIQNSLQAGIAQDRDRARNALAEQVAGLNAGYLTQLGSSGLNQRAANLQNENAQRNRGLDFGERSALQLAGQGNMGLAYGERSLGNETGLGLEQLRFMSNISAPYPEAGLYANLAQMFGSQQRGDADNARLQSLLTQLGQGGGARPGPTVDPRTGVMPGFSRGAGGGPPPATPNTGGGMNFLPGAGGPTMGGPMTRPVQMQGTSPGLGASAFGGSSGGLSGGGGSFDYGNQAPADAYAALFGGGFLGAGVPTSGFDAGGFGVGGGAGGMADAYGDYFPQDDGGGWGGGVGALASGWADAAINQEFENYGIFDY